MRGAARIVLASFLLSAGAAPGAFSAGIQRYLASLRLGDTLEQIQKIYPPKREWSRYREPGGEVVRIIMERGYAEWFPPKVDTIRLGMRRGRLIHVQLIYGKRESRRKPLQEVVKDLSLVYGEPRRSGETYFWFDDSAVIAASNVGVPSGRKQAKELRTSIELMERGYFEPYR